MNCLTAYIVRCRFISCNDFKCSGDVIIIIIIIIAQC